MDIKEAVKLSVSDDNYPDVITSESGLIEIPELNVVGINSWDRLNRGNKRKVWLNITTWRGISSNAVPYYGKIVANGVYQATLGNLAKPRNLTTSEEKQYPLLNYQYDFTVKRCITQKEIDKDPEMWYAYTENDLTERFNSMDDLISLFKEIVKLRFIGEWEVTIVYPNGRREVYLIN